MFFNNKNFFFFINIKDNDGDGCIDEDCDVFCFCKYFVLIEKKEFLLLKDICNEVCK